MKRIAIVVVLAVGSLVAATALTLGALALAGGDLGDVVHPRLDRPVTVSQSPNGRDDSPSASASVDDHGGASEPGDDHGGGSNSGSGGPGSSGSGSGEGHSGDD